MKASPLHPLTSLRFFAAAAIVTGHMTSSSLGGLPGDGRYGLGVGFFFVLSGFILTYVYRDFTGHSVRSFYVARFARLWPVHLVTFLIAALVIQPNALFSPLYAITAPINLLMLHAWIPINGLVFSWNAPSWSISAELWFYILFPFLAATSRLGMWFVGLTLIAAIIVISVPPVPSRPFEFWHVHVILQHPAVRVVEFVVGVAAGRLFNAGRRIEGNSTLLEVAAIAGVAFYAVTSTAVQAAIAGAGHEKIGLWYGQSGGVLVFAFAIFVFAQNGGLISQALSVRTLVLLGEISFSTYMLHQLLIRAALKYDWLSYLGRPATIIVVLVLIYVGSWLLWRFIEVPCRRAIIAKAAQPISLKL